MTIALWIRRTDTDLTDEEIDRALATVRADPLVEGHADGLVVAGTLVRMSRVDGLPRPEGDDDDEAVRAWATDPRRFRHLVLESTLESGWPALRFTAMLLASEVGASAYDPGQDEWLMASETTVADLRDDLTT